MALGYGKTHGTLWLHPKWLTLPGAARGLWATGLSYSVAMQTFGDIAGHMLPMLGGTPEDATALVEAGLWDATEGGWRMHDWDDHQTSREKFERVSAVRAESGRRGGLATSKTPTTSADKQNAKQGASNREATASKAKQEVKLEEEVEVEVEATSPPTPPEGGTDTGQLFEVPAARRRTGVYSDEFEAAWKAYPRPGRQAKRDAAKAYEKARRSGTDAATIQAGIERYATEIERTGHAVKWMQGWLNGERWCDTEPLEDYRRPAGGRPSASDRLEAGRAAAAWYTQENPEQRRVSA